MKKILFTLLGVVLTLSAIVAQIRATPSAIERLSGSSVLSNISFNSSGGLSVNGTTDVVLNADDDIGIYAEDDIFIDAGGIRRMTFSSGGNIGIGTSSPTSNLDIRGSLVLENGTNAHLYTGTGSSELNRYLLLLNSPSLGSASGLKTGGLLVADSYSYGNPGKNDLIVKGAVTIGDEVIKDTGENSLAFGARLRPLSDDTYDLGVSNRRWKDLYMSGSANFARNVTVGVDLVVGDEVIKDTGENSLAFGARLRPLSDDTYDLGVSNRRWQDLYLSGSSFINGSLDVENGLEASTGTASNAGFFDGAVCTNDGYYTCSDARLKEKTIEIENATDIITQLRPVEYNYKTQKVDFKHFPSERQYGLLAQELEKVLPSLVKDNIAIIYDELDIENQEGESDIDTPKEAKTLQYKSVNYIGLIPFLIANAQEQQNIIKEKEERITKIEAELAELKTLVQQLASSNIQSRTEVLNQTPNLKQNQPNPFNENTTIQYYLPEATQQASVNISDINGKVIKVIPLQGTGQGQIELQTGTLGGGIYAYSLVVDGQIVESKQMVLTK